MICAFGCYGGYLVLLTCGVSVCDDVFWLLIILVCLWYVGAEVVGLVLCLTLFCCGLLFIWLVWAGCAALGFAYLHVEFGVVALGLCWFVEVLVLRCLCDLACFGLVYVGCAGLCGLFTSLGW